MKRKKLLRVTTVDLSLDALLRGQLRFLNQYMDVVGVAADTGLLPDVARREGVRVVGVPMHREISPVNDVRSLMALIRLFRRERPDIVHANTPKGSLLAMAAAWWTHVPHRLYTVTGLRYQGSQGLMRWLLKTMERMSCLLATRVIPEGQGVLHTLQADHITRKPLSVIYHGNINGIDTAYYAPGAVDMSRDEARRRLNLQSADFAFIFIGRIVADKGMNELAECLRRLVPQYPQLKLILVGKFESELDPLKGDNEQFFSQSAAVRFVGWQDDVRPFLLAADALVFPSYREGFPNVPMQAGAMGLPGIVTNINGCNEIVKDGLNGRIIRPRDVEALGDAMRWFLDHGAEVERMARNCRRMIQERYEQKDVWSHLLEMYQSL